MRVVITSIIGFCLLSGSLSPASAKGNRIRTEQLRFKSGQTSIRISRKLLIGYDHAYQFKARAGQKMTVELSSPPNKYDAPDVVFVIQTTHYYDKSRDTLLLDGFDRNGDTAWSGDLPITGEYEIYVSLPVVSDHAINHSITYRLSVSIK